jgi:hypothetical protein
VVHYGVTANGKIGASADRGRKIGHPRVDALTIDNVERIRADAMLGRAVEIRYTCQAEPLRPRSLSILLFGRAFFAQTKMYSLESTIGFRRASVMSVSIARNNWRCNLPSSANMLFFSNDQSGRHQGEGDETI